MAQETAPLLTLDPLRFIERLPDFSGDRKDLYTFISLVDRINPLLSAYDEPSQLIFFDIIKSKLKGKAKEAIEINFHAQSWEEVKTILTNNFGEKQSVEELYDRLRAVVFKTNAIEFYNEIKDRLRSLNNKTAVDVGASQNSEQIAKSNINTALNVFKAKLPEPMKTILACRNPDSLEEAMDILFSSGYANYEINKNKHRPQTNVNSRSNENFQHNSNRGGQYSSSNRDDFQNNRNNSGSRSSNNNPPNNRNTSNNNHVNRNNANYNYPTSDNRNSHYSQNPPEPMDINMVQNTDTLGNVNQNISESSNLCPNFYYLNSQSQPQMGQNTKISIDETSGNINRVKSLTNSGQKECPEWNTIAQNFLFPASSENYHI